MLGKLPLLVGKGRVKTFPTFIYPEQTPGGCRSAGDMAEALHDLVEAVTDVGE